MAARLVVNATSREGGRSSAAWLTAADDYTTLGPKTTALSSRLLDEQLRETVSVAITALQDYQAQAFRGASPTQLMAGWTAAREALDEALVELGAAWRSAS